MTEFCCNIDALTPTERARHKKLTEKLMANSTNLLETGNGYEFHYSSSVVSLSELCDWVSAESRCCPFFDFHVHFEDKGQLLRLQLTGGQGIKQFVRAEFAIPEQ